MWPWPVTDREFLKDVRGKKARKINIFPPDKKFRVSYGLRTKLAKKPPTLYKV